MKTLPICYHCIYFPACGDPARIEPCKGKVIEEEERRQNEMETKKIITLAQRVMRYPDHFCANCGKGTEEEFTIWAYCGRFTETFCSGLCASEQGYIRTEDGWEKDLACMQD